MWQGEVMVSATGTDSALNHGSSCRVGRERSWSQPQVQTVPTTMAQAAE